MHINTKSTTFRATILWACAALLAFALALAVPNFVRAQTEEAGGSGTLTATGKGTAWFHGSGTITVSGTGTLRIRDYANDAQISVQPANSAKRVFANGYIRYSAFQGTATVTGTHVYIELTGNNISLSAIGHGRYVLRGSGTYTANAENGTWASLTKTL